jgi:pimeloyl-ACP methyl ester carboxylesterase
VTLGTPVVGGARHVAVSYPYRRRGWDLETIERLADEAAQVPIRVPVTAIWSRRDGIVDGRACAERATPGAANVELASSHWGLGFDPDAWAAIARALAAAPQ